MTPFLKVQLRVDHHLKAPVVQKLDNATHRVNHSLVNGMIGFVDTSTNGWHNVLAIISNIRTT